MDAEPEAIQPARPVERETEDDEASPSPPPGVRLRLQPGLRRRRRSLRAAALPRRHRSMRAPMPSPGAGGIAPVRRPRGLQPAVYRARSPPCSLSRRSRPYAFCLATRRSAAPSRISPSAPAAMRLRSSPVNGRPPLDWTGDVPPPPSCPPAVPPVAPPVVAARRAVVDLLFDSGLQAARGRAHCTPATAAFFSAASRSAGV